MRSSRVFRKVLRYDMVMKGRGWGANFVETWVMSWLTIKYSRNISAPPGLTHRCLKDLLTRNAKILRAQILSGVILEARYCVCQASRH